MVNDTEQLREFGRRRQQGKNTEMSRSDTLFSAQTPRPLVLLARHCPIHSHRDGPVAPNDEHGEEWCARLESNQRPRA